MYFVTQYPVLELSDDFQNDKKYYSEVILEDLDIHKNSHLCMYISF